MAEERKPVKFVFPNDTQRCVIVGRTGSGKTQAGIWQLSHRDYDRKPWVVFDFKGDELIADIDGAYSLELGDPIPVKPGLYVVQPTHDQEKEVEEFMWRILQATNTGVFIDEGYMVGKNNRAFRTILTQGRSKRIPVIILTQRPVWMDRFVFSEAEFFQIFQLNQRQDLKNVNEFIPYDITERLPDYHSYYYNATNNTIMKCAPVPDRDVILDTFDAKLAKLPKVL